MTNEIAKTNGNTRDPYEIYADEVSSRAHITGELLRFTKHGQYKAGQNQEEVPEGTRMLAFMPGLKRGWVKWQDAQPVQHILGLVVESYEPPNREDLGDLDEDEWAELNGRKIDPWQDSNYLVMCDTEGTIYTFVSASKGGRSAVGTLAGAYSKHRRMKPDELPVIELHARSYIHKDYGETFAPDLRVVGWSKNTGQFEDLAAIGDSSESDNVLIENMAVKAKPPVKAASPAKGKPMPVKGKPAPQRGGKPTRSVRF